MTTAREGLLTGEGLQAALDDVNELVPVGEVLLRLVRQRVSAKQLLQDVRLLAVVAHPLLAALVRHLHQPGVGAAQVGQGQLLGAQRHAAHRPVDAGALVLAVGLEALAVLVDPAVVLAGTALQLGCRGERRREER